MTDIADATNLIQVEGDRTLSPVGESLMQAMGSAINALLNNAARLDIQEFLDSASYTVGAGVTHLFWFAIGGGGGGGAGGGQVSPSRIRSGGGGGGESGRIKFGFVPSVAGDVWGVVCGSAGVGGAAFTANGTKGGDTTVQRTGPSSLGFLYASGGNPGFGGQPETGAGSPDSGQGGNGSSVWDENNFVAINAAGGPADTGANTGGSATIPGQGGGGGGGGFAGSYVSGAGGSATPVSGGSGFADNSGGGGGAGGSNLIARGGAGGNGGRDTISAAQSGFVGTKGSGGGGGGGMGAGFSTVGAGGNGGKGYVLVIAVRKVKA